MTGIARMRRGAARAIAVLGSIAGGIAFAQQPSIVGTWGTTLQGSILPISVTIRLLPTGQFEQDMQSGTSPCLHTVTVGNYGLVQQPDTYHFDVTGQEPSIDCTGHQVVPQTGWSARLQLVDANTLGWYDLLTGGSATFRRLQ